VACFLRAAGKIRLTTARDGQVRNTAFYVVMGVTVAGERDILGIWAGGDGGEGPRFWLQVFTELKNRGVEDVLIAVCDGLKGLPEAITTTWEHTIVQQCTVHLIRASFRYAGRQHRDGVCCVGEAGPRVRETDLVITFRSVSSAPAGYRFPAHRDCDHLAREPITDRRGGQS
jgi:transposase-like protein